ncbi:MAG: GNAT family N-acetyltransferase [Eubacterium sp.]|nr:GNAT family N-acetyltransferase [Eubacterium sp.]
MKIRRAEQSDIPRIIELLGQVNNVHADGRPDLFIHDRTKYTAEELEEILCDPVTPVFVATDESEYVSGYAFTQVRRTIGQNNLQDQVELYIDDICVDKNCRRQGVAKRLYEEVVHYAKKNAYDRITLHVWECNPGAVAFYKKCGMVPYYYAMEQVL